MPNSADLKINGKSIELPIVNRTEGEKAIDIRQLRAQTGYVTLDQGFMNTGAVTSNIAFVGDDAGILHYRGIPIEELAEKSSFVEVAYLLIYGRLPKSDELAQFSSFLTMNSALHEDPASKIDRPRQIYTGTTKAHYAPIDQRS
jgi:citrate synthase